MNFQNASLLADRLEMVLEGKMSLEGILNGSEEFGPSLALCFHGLQHYLADEDIRRNDPAYRAMQEGEMRKLIQFLRSNAGPSVLSAVNFLGRSDV